MAFLPLRPGCARRTPAPPRGKRPKKTRETAGLTPAVSPHARIACGPLSGDLDLDLPGLEGLGLRHVHGEHAVLELRQDLLVVHVPRHGERAQELPVGPL